MPAEILKDRRHAWCELTASTMLSSMCNGGMPDEETVAAKRMHSDECPQMVLLHTHHSTLALFSNYYQTTSCPALKHLWGISFSLSGIRTYSPVSWFLDTSSS